MARTLFHPGPEEIIFVRAITSLPTSYALYLGPSRNIQELRDEPKTRLLPIRLTETLLTKYFLKSR